MCDLMRGDPTASAVIWPELGETTINFLDNVLCV